MNIRKDDMVKVITGVDKGKVAKVLRVLIEKNKVVVEGIAQVYKHTQDLGDLALVHARDNFHHVVFANTHDFLLRTSLEGRP